MQECAIELMYRILGSAATVPMGEGGDFCGRRRNAGAATSNTYVSRLAARSGASSA